jgi:hypothetical protein
VDLSSNDLGVEGVVELAVALEGGASGSNLTDLDLSRNSIGAEGTCMVIAALLHGRTGVGGPPPLPAGVEKARSSGRDRKSSSRGARSTAEAERAALLPHRLKVLKLWGNRCGPRGVRWAVLVCLCLCVCACVFVLVCLCFACCSAC